MCSIIFNHNKLDVFNMLNDIANSRFTRIIVGDVYYTTIKSIYGINHVHVSCGMLWFHMDCDKIYTEWDDLESLDLHLEHLTCIMDGFTLC